MPIVSILFKITDVGSLAWHGFRRVLRRPNPDFALIRSIIVIIV